MQGKTITLDINERAFIVDAVNLWVNTVFEVANVIDDRQQLWDLLQGCGYAKALLAKLKED